MSQVAKAVFPAAGLGTRFLPATKAQPKEMLPLVDKPAIQYVIEEAVESGIRDVIIVTGRGKNAIEDHFDRSIELELTLEARGKQEQLAEIRRISELIDLCYVRQKEALGLGHAILVTREVVGHEPFAILLGDDIVDSEVPCLKQLLQVHAAHGASVVAVERVAPERTRDYGVIDGTSLGGGLYRVNDLVEKPDPSQAPSNLAIIGRYVLMPEIFAELARTGADAKGEIQLTHGLKALLERQPIFALEFEGKRFDTGSKIGFLKATVELALKRADLGKEFRDYLLSLEVRR